MDNEIGCGYCYKEPLNNLKFNKDGEEINKQGLLKKDWCKKHDPKINKAKLGCREFKHHEVKK